MKQPTVTSDDILAYEFGPFYVDLADRLLLRGGQSVHLAPKVFDVLVRLLAESGRLVEKEQLMNEVWPQHFVEDNNLTVSICAIRKALGEGAGPRKYIETVPKRGYCFVASAREIRRVLKEERRAKGWKAQGSGPRERRISSLAVLPFLNTSRDPDLDYLCDGITESLISSLSQLGPLNVLGRGTTFRYRGVDVDPLEVGRVTGSGAVLVGRVSKSDCLMINAELVDASDGSQMWSERYSRRLSDIITAHEEIAAEISSRLRLKLSEGGRKKLAKRHTSNSDAYHFYLKGRYFWNKYTHEGGSKAINYFHQAIEADPNYALAYAGLADAYQRISDLYLPAREALPKAMTAALKSVEIDDELSEAHAALGLLKVFYDHDWASAEREYRRAIELNPGASLAHKRYGEYLMFTGRFKEALLEYNSALKLDPLSLQVNVSLGTNLRMMRRFGKSIELLKRTLEMNPGYCPPHVALALTYLHMGAPGEAISELKLACKLEKEANLPLGFLGYAYALDGRAIPAEKILGRLKARYGGKRSWPFGIALIYLGLGKKDQAMDWLERTYEERSDWLVWLGVGSEFDGIRSDPRFDALLRLVGFKK